MDKDDFIRKNFFAQKNKWLGRDRSAGSSSEEDAYEDMTTVAQIHEDQVASGSRVDDPSVLGEVDMEDDLMNTTTPVAAMEHQNVSAKHPQPKSEDSSSGVSSIDDDYMAEISPVLLPFRISGEQPSTSGGPFVPGRLPNIISSARMAREDQVHVTFQLLSKSIGLKPRRLNFVPSMTKYCDPKYNPPSFNTNNSPKRVYTSQSSPPWVAPSYTMDSTEESSPSSGSARDADMQSADDKERTAQWRTSMVIDSDEDVENKGLSFNEDEDFFIVPIMPELGDAKLVQNFQTSSNAETDTTTMQSETIPSKSEGLHSETVGDNSLPSVEGNDWHVVYGDQQIQVSDIVGQISAVCVSTPEEAHISITSANSPENEIGPGNEYLQNQENLRRDNQGETSEEEGISITSANSAGNDFGHGNEDLQSREDNEPDYQVETPEEDISITSENQGNTQQQQNENKASGSKRPLEEPECDQIKKKPHVEDLTISRTYFATKRKAQETVESCHKGTDEELKDESSTDDEETEEKKFRFQ